MQEGWQYNSLVDFQLGVKLDSSLLPLSCTCIFSRPRMHESVHIDCLSVEPTGLQLKEIQCVFF